MATAVKLSEHIVSAAKPVSRALNRSDAGQIEHWAKIGKIAEENPDLTYDLIKKILNQSLLRLFLLDDFAEKSRG